MSVPMVPHRFVDASNLDMEKVNDDLEAIARDVNRNLSRRYTYSSLTFDISGLTDASATALRTCTVGDPDAGGGITVVGVELVIYTATAVTWTVTCSDTTWPSLTLATTASATTESLAESNSTVQIGAATTFIISASGASTITNGYLVLHLRCDRGNQGAAHTAFAPTLVDSSTSTAGSVLDTQLTNAATSVAADTANNKDLRCECFVVRGLAAGASVVWRLPSGARRKAAHALIFAVADVTETVTFDIDGQSNSLVGGGVAAIVSDNIDTSGTAADAPMTAASDTIVTISDAGAATALLAYCLVFWS